MLSSDIHLQEDTFPKHCWPKKPWTQNIKKCSNFPMPKWLLKTLRIIIMFASFHKVSFYRQNKKVGRSKLKACRRCTGIERAEKGRCCWAWIVFVSYLWVLITWRDMKDGARRCLKRETRNLGHVWCCGGASSCRGVGYIIYNLYVPQTSQLNKDRGSIEHIHSSYYRY